EPLGVSYPPLTLFTIVVGLVLMSIFVSWRIGVNEFSMHHFYKNRLVRCYLGASRWQVRKADWFTGFDSNDDVPLWWFDHEPPPSSKDKTLSKENEQPSGKIEETAHPGSNDKTPSKEKEQPSGKVEET